MIVQAAILYNEFQIHTFKIIPVSPRANELKDVSILQPH